MEEEKNKAGEYKQVTSIMRGSRIIYLNDPIDKDSAQRTNRALLMLDELNNDPIKLFINSPGGEVNSGFFIFDCIKFVRSPVYIVGAGLVASAAALIYLAVDKEYRLSLPHARYMLHQPLSGSRGVVTDLEIHAKEVEELKHLINEIIADATGNSLKRVEKDTDRDFWLNPTEAKKYGMVHTIIENKDDFPSIFPRPKEESKKREADKSSDSKKGKKSTTKTKKEKSKKVDSDTSKSVKPAKKSSGKDNPTKN